MLKEPTLDKLKGLRLDAMATAWQAQHATPDITSLAFDDRLGFLVDAEWVHCENKRMARALREAKLRLTSACLEDLEYGGKREFDRAVVRQLDTFR